MKERDDGRSWKRGFRPTQSFPLRGFWRLPFGVRDRNTTIIPLSSTTRRAFAIYKEFFLYCLRIAISTLPSFNEYFNLRTILPFLQQLLNYFGLSTTSNIVLSTRAGLSIIYLYNFTGWQTAEEFLEGVEWRVIILPEGRRSRGQREEEDVKWKDRERRKGLEEGKSSTLRGFFSIAPLCVSLA